MREDDGEEGARKQRKAKDDDESSTIQGACPDVLARHFTVAVTDSCHSVTVHRLLREHLLQRFQHFCRRPG